MWNPPEYSFESPPSSQATLSAGETSDSRDFFRQARWCADGSSFLASTERSQFQLLVGPFGRETPVQRSTFPQPAPIVDFAWYPAASARDEASFCFLASVRDCPLKLLHGSDGRLRASYPIIDHRERCIAPHSIAFAPGTTNIYCGFEDAIEVFDMNRPGNEGIRLPTTPSKKSKDGLKGIVSAIAFPPYTDAGESYLAAGSLSPSGANITLFDTTQGAEAAPLLFLDTGPYNVRAGVMQLQFNPTKPHLLYASFRRHGPLYEWDIRGDGGAPSRVFAPSENHALSRTNQKLRFDIDPTGRWLAVGDQMGDISLFDLDSTAQPAGADEVPSTAGPVPSTMAFHAHEDAVGSVSFHPLEPQLLSVSGSWHFETKGSALSQHLLAETASTSDSSESDGELDTDSDLESDLPAPLPSAAGLQPVTRRKYRPRPVALDNSVKFWACG